MFGVWGWKWFGRKIYEFMVFDDEGGGNHYPSIDMYILETARSSTKSAPEPLGNYIMVYNALETIVSPIHHASRDKTPRENV